MNNRRRLFNARALRIDCTLRYDAQNDRAAKTIIGKHASAVSVQPSRFHADENMGTWYILINLVTELFEYMS